MVEFSAGAENMQDDPSTFCGTNSKEIFKKNSSKKNSEVMSKAHKSQF